MPVSATTLQKLIDAGITGQNLVDIVASIDADHAVAQPKQRSSQALRQERYRQRKASQNVTRDVTKRDGALFLEEDLTESKKEIEDTVTPRQELETVLDAKHAGWVIDHRKRLRKPLSARAAHQLAAKLKLFTDPNAAADVMIEKGWSSIEVDWLSKSGTNGAAVPIKVNGHQPSANLDTLSEEDWLKRLSYCRERREWKAYLGPPPFAPGCKVPPHLLDERDKQMRLEHVS